MDEDFSKFLFALYYGQKSRVPNTGTKNFPLTYYYNLNRAKWPETETGNKKSSKSFSRLTAFAGRQWAAGIQFLWLVRRIVKLKFEQTSNKRLLHIVLHLGIDLSVHFGEIADISGVVEQDSVHGFWVALTGFEDCFIGEKSCLLYTSHGSAKNGLGIQPLMDAVTGLFQPIGQCRRMFITPLQVVAPWLINR